MERSGGDRSANPRWYEEKLGRLSRGGWAGPPARGRACALGNDRRNRISTCWGELAELRPNADAPDVSWQAFWLPSQPAGRTCWKSMIPATLCRRWGSRSSSRTPPRAGGADGRAGNRQRGGVCLRRSALAAAPADLLARTTSPLALLTIGRQNAPAECGKMTRLRAGPSGRPAAPCVLVPNRRLLAAYLDRPLIAQDFFAAWKVGPLERLLSGRLADVLRRRHAAGRLSERRGLQWAMLAVAADGSTIYPSPALEPTPRYERGVLCHRPRPRAKIRPGDAAAAVRSGGFAGPTVEFASPLPELEAVCGWPAPGRGRAAGIGPEGAPWCAAWPARVGTCADAQCSPSPRPGGDAPRAPRVGVAPYAAHPSFAGLAVRLSANGYAQSPGPDWGLDDETIAASLSTTPACGCWSTPAAFRRTGALREPQRLRWAGVAGRPTRPLLPLGAADERPLPVPMPGSTGGGRHARRRPRRRPSPQPAATLHPGRGHVAGRDRRPVLPRRVAMRPLASERIVRGAT